MDQEPLRDEEPQDALIICQQTTPSGARISVECLHFLIADPTALMLGLQAQTSASRESGSDGRLCQRFVSSIYCLFHLLRSRRGEECAAFVPLEHIEHVS